MELHVSEIFHSIQGEAGYAGWPCVFVRLVGCNVRCAWCDTRYAYDGGTLMSVADAVSKAAAFGCPLAEVTGGEPMMQGAASIDLMRQLQIAGIKVLLETNGTLDLDAVPDGVVRIIDLKPPTSRVRHDASIWNHYADSWRDEDEVKCVVSNRDDFDWCVQKLSKYKALGKIAVYFSPVWGSLEPSILADWICTSNLPVRLNIQLQKIIWDPNARGV